MAVNSIGAEAENEEEEDDYMSMAFTEDQPPKAETSIQRRARKQRESELKAKPKSKEELVIEETQAREKGLATSLDDTNKGFKIMQKLGFKGGPLGKEGNDARVEPIGLEIKEDRGGIGLDSEKKRKIREQAEYEETETKRIKEDEDGFRKRSRLEREEKRREGQIIGAMVVAERLDQDTNEPPASTDASNDGGVAAKASSKQLSKINVLWRGLVKHRIEKERERRMRYDFQNSLTRRLDYEEEDEDRYDRQAYGQEEEEELDVEDAELDAFNAQDAEKRLSDLVDYLRKTHNYCFWCKFQYSDTNMEGCPGTAEEDHD